MTRTKKTVDAVQLMRSIREQIAEETQGLNAEEQMRWLRASQPRDAFLAKLSQIAAQRAASTDYTKRLR